MEERIYQLALKKVPQIGDVQARLLVQQFGSAAAVFRAPRAVLEGIEGMGRVRAAAIKAFRDFGAAEAELRFAGRHGLQLLFLTDAAYPQRLLHCYDAPPLLFVRGQPDLNAARALSIVGTRHPTDYGRSMTEECIRAWAAFKPLIVSGLAYGIDAAAHRAALRHGLPTIGVVAHSLDQLYPPDHRPLAREMVAAGGGLLTEFGSGTAPDRHNFPLRNRIVAGLCEAVVVMETEVKGGSMITARLADGYHRDVFALPGRTTDRKSSGCNTLIKEHKAVILSDPADLPAFLGWTDASKQKTTMQRALFLELSADERRIVELLQAQESMPIDELCLHSGCSTSATAAAILNLELQGVVGLLPGKRYRLI